VRGPHPTRGSPAVTIRWLSAAVAVAALLRVAGPRKLSLAMPAAKAAMLRFCIPLGAFEFLYLALAAVAGVHRLGPRAGQVKDDVQRPLRGR
jgi:hypothetical protein